MPKYCKKDIKQIQGKLDQHQSEFSSETSIQQSNYEQHIQEQL